ncbi:MAG: metal ABC transporter permease [Planctomycetes bacterium]|nr:metal ABC transporter permease [Planctomycetota bacterium]
MSDAGFFVWLSEPLQYRFVCRGLGMALLLGVSGGLIGCVLLLRRIVLMADSFGHSLLPGIGIAYLLVGPGMGGLFIGALIAGLCTTVMSGTINRLTRLKEDAAFGSLFVLCFAGGVALMSHVAAPVDLMHYLFGNVLGVTANDLYLVTAVSCGTVIATCIGYRALLMETFDPQFFRSCGGRSFLTHLLVLGATVLNLVAALQAVGMVLALGLFILPAVTAYLWCERFGTMLIVAAGYGGVAACAGLYVSYYLNLPSGACMVGCLGVGYLLSLLISPRHGIIARVVRSRRHEQEDSPAECTIR